MKGGRPLSVVLKAAGLSAFLRPDGWKSEGTRTCLLTVKNGFREQKRKKKATIAHIFKAYGRRPNCPHCLEKIGVRGEIFACSVVAFGLNGILFFIPSSPARPHNKATRPAVRFDNEPDE